MGMRRWFAKLTHSSSNCDTSLTPPINSPTVQNSITKFPPPPSPPVTNWGADFASDPGSWEELFNTHWKCVEKIIIADNRDFTSDSLSSFFRRFGQMIQLLMMEINAQPESAIGPILDCYFTHQIMERVVDWALDLPSDLLPFCQVKLLQIYEVIVGESHTQNHCLLVHKPVLLPLMKLLESCRFMAECRRNDLSDMIKHFVVLLHQICMKMAKDKTLLLFFFTFNEISDDQFLVFNYLIPYLYDADEIGQLARDALLLILSVSRSLKQIASFIAFKSNFCPVVATGLSGCFSQLSRNISAFLNIGDDFHKICLDEVETYASLNDFYSSLLFCNAIIQVAHEFIATQLITYIYDGFLLPVVLPSLLQNGVEELISSTAYYHLCLETVTEADLLQSFIKLLIVEQCEPNKKIIDVIVERISLGNRLSQLCLSLLRTLIDLRCEDFMLDLIFRYLLPCSFIQPNQKNKFKNDYSLPAANYLLSVIPECTLKFPFLCSNDTFSDYLNETRDYVQETVDACARTWAWKYDGKNPPPSLFQSCLDEESSGSHTTSEFIRQSSIRSSSSRLTMNRYFNKLPHYTLEGLHQCLPLPVLGAAEISPTDLCYLTCDGISPTPLDDDIQLLPSIPNNSLMTSSYFQFAYDEISESETEQNATVLLKNDLVNGEEKIGVCKKEQNKVSADELTSGGEQTKSFVLRGWSQAEVGAYLKWTSHSLFKDLTTFIELLDLVSPCKIKHSLEENLALIDSRIQYLDELKAEVAEKAEKENGQFNAETAKCESEEIFSSGYPIICQDHQGVGPFLESLLRLLDNMLENSLYVNLHLISVISSLASYPHSLLAYYFFDQNMSVRPGVKSLLKILSSLKSRIDAYASSQDGFDILLERGIKFLKYRVDRFERASESMRSRYSLQSCSSHETSRIDQPNYLSRFGNFSSGLRRGGGGDSSQLHSFRYFSHKAIENRDTFSDQNRAKQVAFAAILLSQLCQELASTTLNHSTIVPQLNFQC